MNYGRLAAGVLAALIWVGGLPAAETKLTLDESLLGLTPAIYHRLNSEKIGTIGVLPFHVVKEGKKSGPSLFGSILAERLENALLIGHNDRDSVKAILQKVGITAEQLRVGLNDYAKLFKADGFPSMIGSQRLRSDGFLTGQVTVNRGLKDITVKLQLATKSDPKLRDLHTFQVRMDRTMLHDLGETFSIKSRGLDLKKRSMIDLDEEASQSAEQRDDSDKPSAAADEVGAHGVAITVYYDDVAQSIAGDPMSAGEMRLAPPAPGRRLKIRIRSTEKTARAILVTLNGENLLQRQRSDPQSSRLFILEPGKETMLEGFYVGPNDESIAPIKALTPEESVARETNFDPNRVGLLEVAVFEQGKPLTDDELSVSLRGLKLPVKARSLTELKTAARKKAHIKSVKTERMPFGLLGKGRNLFDADASDLRPGGTEQAAFPDRKHVATMSIRYYNPKVN